MRFTNDHMMIAIAEREIEAMAMIIAFVFGVHLCKINRLPRQFSDCGRVHFSVIRHLKPIDIID